jgi:murein DD-endopeptidase MepM/ murein hydrolase activator NlpD
MFIPRDNLRLLGVFLLLVMIYLSACTGGMPPDEVSLEDQIQNTADPADEVSTAGQGFPLPTSTATGSRSITPTSTQPPAVQTDTPAPVDPPTATPAESAISDICSPLEEHALDELAQIISAPYDPPPAGKEQRHHGTDFSYYRRGERTSILGVGVQSVLDGVVVARGEETFPYGNFLIIETRQENVPVWLQDEIELTGEMSLYLLYAHMQDAPRVNLGEPISSCQLIGNVGASGNAVEPHLHLEARLGPAGRSFPDGLAFYHTQTTEEQRENYTAWRTGGDYMHFDPMIILNLSADKE